MTELSPDLPPLKRADLRRILEHTLRTEEIIDSFVVDSFPPEVYRRLRDRTYVGKLNELLAELDTDQILRQLLHWVEIDERNEILRALRGSPVEVSRPLLSLGEVFPTTGVPQYTLVDPEQLVDIVDGMRRRGMGLLVEGPSGIGKTTAVRRALQLLPADAPKVIWKNGRLREDQDTLRRIVQSGLHDGGHLIVDDFHRVPADLRQDLADLIKSLSDSARQDAKVTLIGINPLGSSLIGPNTDIVGRYVTVDLRRQPAARIADLLRKGEHALNIEFRQRDSFISEARGSFLTAQALCYECARKEGVVETERRRRTLVAAPGDYAVDRVQQHLAERFDAGLRDFAAFDALSPPRGAALALLWMLHESSENSVSLAAASQRFPVLREAIEWLQKGKLQQRFEQAGHLRELFYWNREGGVLSIEDPRLDFYLQHLNWSAFIRDTGHRRDRVFWTRQRGLEIYPAENGSISGLVPPITLPDGQLPNYDLPESYVLHLSDLHFQSITQVVLWLDQLEADLRDSRALAIPKLDAIIVSGDISESSSSEQFDAAEQFLWELRKSYKLPPHRLVLVPGNHDVSWEYSRAAYQEIDGAQIDRDKLRGFEGAWVEEAGRFYLRDDAKYAHRFSPFADFFKRACMQAYPLEAEMQSTLHAFPQIKLLCLGLNSAWICDHQKQYRGRASIHGAALAQALRTLRQEPTFADWLKIAVWHHPTQGSEDDRIRDTGFLDRLSQAGFRIGLHGHIHSAGIASHRSDLTLGGRPLDLLGAGTFGAPTKEWRSGVPLQYQLLRIKGNRLTVYSRCKDNPEGVWRADGRWGMGKAASEYEIEL